jgi:hypothetical protein
VIVASFFVLDMLLVSLFAVLLVPLRARFVWGFWSHFGGTGCKAKERIR